MWGGRKRDTERVCGVYCYSMGEKNQNACSGRCEPPDSFQISEPLERVKTVTLYKVNPTSVFQPHKWVATPQVGCRGSRVPAV